MRVRLNYGTVFWNLGKKRERQQDLLNVIGSMYAAVLFLGVTNATTVQPVVEVERTVFYREKAAGMYSAMPYAFGQVLIEVPYVIIQAVLYSVVVYSMIQFEWTAVKFFWYLFFMFLTFMYFTYYGMMAVGVTPNYHVAAIVSSAFYSVWNLFCGYIIARPSIPVWWRWYYWATPVSWTLYGLIASQLGDVETLMTLSDGSGRQEPVKQFLKSYFGIKHDFLGAVAGVMVAIPIGFALLFALIIVLLPINR